MSRCVVIKGEVAVRLNLRVPRASVHLVLSSQPQILAAYFSSQLSPARWPSMLAPHVSQVFEPRGSVVASPSRGTPRLLWAALPGIHHVMRFELGHRRPRTRPTTPEAPTSFHLPVAAHVQREEARIGTPKTRITSSAPSRLKL
jgi:hypothetical protein